MADASTAPLPVHTRVVAFPLGDTNRVESSDRLLPTSSVDMAAPAFRSRLSGWRPARWTGTTHASSPRRARDRAIS